MEIIWLFRTALRRASGLARTSAALPLFPLLLAAALVLPAGAPASALPRGTEPSPPVAEHRTAWDHLPADDFVLYMPQKYEACLSCHPKEMAEEEDFNVDTNWRDTTLGKNLHSLHVYRQPTGVNCSVCHALDKDNGVRYGERVNLKAAEKGGACTPACHRPKSYHNAGRFRFVPPPPAVPAP